METETAAQLGYSSAAAAHTGKREKKAVRCLCSLHTLSLLLTLLVLLLLLHFHEEWVTPVQSPRVVSE